MQDIADVFFVSVMPGLVSVNIVFSSEDLIALVGWEWHLAIDKIEMVL